jgi:hypothetical protein
MLEQNLHLLLSYHVQVSLNIATVRSHCLSGLRGRDGLDGQRDDRDG